MSEDILLPGESIADLLSHLPLTAPVRAELLRCMTAPGRQYHDIRHIALLWARHRLMSRGGALDTPRLNRMIAAAIAFHDVVYDARRRDNELRSAALWRHAAARCPGFTRQEVEWVAGTIEATADHLAAPDAADMLGQARLWVLDLDLTPLGESRVVFDRNTRKLRAEFRHMSERDWCRSRVAFLSGLQGHARLYRSPRIATAFELQARRNIARELVGVAGCV